MFLTLFYFLINWFSLLDVSEFCTIIGLNNLKLTLCLKYSLWFWYMCLRFNFLALQLCMTHLHIKTYYWWSVLGETQESLNVEYSWEWVFFLFVCFFLNLLWDVLKLHYFFTEIFFKVTVFPLHIFLYFRWHCRNKQT